MEMLSRPLGRSESSCRENNLRGEEYGGIKHESEGRWASELRQSKRTGEARSTGRKQWGARGENDGRVASGERAG
jgi:hypothetical protein